MYSHIALLNAARTWAEAGQAYTDMMLTSGQVIHARSSRMALGTMRPDEARRMVFEKPAIFAKSFAMAARAQAASEGQAAVTLAALQPLVEETGANARRLAHKQG